MECQDLSIWYDWWISSIQYSKIGWSPLHPKRHRFRVRPHMSVFFLLPSRQSAVGDLNQRHYNLKSNGGTGDARPGLVPILSCQIFSVSPADAYKRPRLFPPSPYITQHHMSTSPDLGFSGVTTRRSERADPFQVSPADSAPVSDPFNSACSASDPTWLVMPAASLVVADFVVPVVFGAWNWIRSCILHVSLMPSCGMDWEERDVGLWLWCS